MIQEEDRWTQRISWLLLLILGLLACMPFWAELDRVRLPEPDDDWDNQLLLANAQRESLLEYHSAPLWNRYPEGGSPLLANPESSIAYPLTWLTLPLDPQLGVRIQVVLHLLLGLATTTAFLRATRLSTPASAYGAVMFMASSLFAERMQVGHLMWMGMAWLPLVLQAGVERGRRAQLLAAVGLAMMWLLGAHYLVIFGGVALTLLLLIDGIETSTSRARSPWKQPGWQAAALGLVALWLAPGVSLSARVGLLLLPTLPLLRLGSGLLRALGRVGQTALLAAGLSAVKLLPALELLAYSSRFGNPELESAAQPGFFTAMARWAGMVARDTVAPHEDQPTFWHPIPVLLALGGLYYARRTQPRLLILLVLAVGWSLGQNPWLPVDALMQSIPGVALVRYPGRAALLTWLCLAFLAAASIDGLGESIDRQSDKLRKSLKVLLYGGLLASASLMAVRASDQYGGLFVPAEPASSSSLAGQGGPRAAFARSRCLPPELPVAGAPADSNGPTGAASAAENSPVRRSMLVAFWAGLGCVDGFSAVPLVNARNVKAQPDEGYRGEAWVEGADIPVMRLTHTPNRLEITLAPAGAASGQAGRLIINQSYFPGWQLEADGSGTAAQVGKVASTAEVVSERGLLAVTLDGRATPYVLSFHASSAAIGLIISVLASGGLLWAFRKASGSTFFG